jgi:site-specific DNA recombinase
MRSPVGPFRARRWRCLSEDIDQESFAHMHTEQPDRLASIKLQLDPADRSHDEMAELAARVFELLQTKRQQWLTADYPEKRRLLEIVFLNCRLDGATLVDEMRKHFDVLAEGLVYVKSRRQDGY